MSGDDRPDPDNLLRAIRAEEERARKGSLRVFLGMSAGVGKTYAMLEAGQLRLRQGADVMVGVVETHGRRETMALTEGLPSVSKKKIEYKGIMIEEMDLDTILAGKPDLVLVDELAHTNAPGSRNSKRYLDVLELLDAGIDVYTTINVQHLESRKDLVEKISGVPIRETVPDSVLEIAKQVEVIDITPAELLQRLKEGKVYVGDKAERAAANFFKQDSLTALREIALRFTAEKVDQELQRFREFKTAAGPWPTNERLMVAVSHSPYSERLIRATRRLAYNLEAPWIAVHIENGTVLNNEDQNQLAKNLNLARELKAEVITTSDPDIPSALRRIARQKNVTQIVVGRPTKRFIRDFIEGGNLLDRLVSESWEVDVHVLRQDDVPKFRVQFIPRLNFESGLLPYWNTLCLFFGLALLGGLLEPVLGYKAIGFLFLLGVLLIGKMATLGPVVFAAFLSAVTWNFFFVPPRWTFVINSAEDFILFMTNFVIALITGTMTNRLRQHERLMRDREERTNVLYEVLKDISVSAEKAEFLNRVNVRMGEVLSGHCGVALRDVDGKLSNSHEKRHGVYLDDKEYAVAQWAFENKKIVGWSTDTLSQSKSLYVPLEGNYEVVGVFVYTPAQERKLSLDQENLLHSVCRQLAVSLERHFAEKRVREAERLEASERLHQTLLNSISHEMRTPLTAIMGIATAMTDQKLRGELTGAGDRLNRVIENLLDMSRLTSGVLEVKSEWHDVTDLVGVVLNRLRSNLEPFQVKVSVQNDLSLIKIDFRLFEHAMTNIVYNATVYTPHGTEILIDVHEKDGHMTISIEDGGPGIAEEHLSRIFDKFYRVPGSPSGGTGLGLSIAKGIVEAHGGKIWAEKGTKGGARFVISLRLDDQPSTPRDLA